VGLFIDQCLSGSTPQFDAVPVQLDIDKRRGSGPSDATRSGADDEAREAAAAGGKSISPGPLSHIPVLRDTRASCTSRAILKDYRGSPFLFVS